MLTFSFYKVLFYFLFVIYLRSVKYGINEFS